MTRRRLGTGASGNARLEARLYAERERSETALARERRRDWRYKRNRRRNASGTKDGTSRKEDGTSGTKDGTSAGRRCERERDGGGTKSGTEAERNAHAEGGSSKQVDPGPTRLAEKARPKSGSGTWASICGRNLVTVTVTVTVTV